MHALLALPCKSAIIDAEVVALKEDGSPDFRALHSGNYTQDNLCAWCFDLLALNDTDMRPLPLVARKLKLGTLLKRYNHGSLRYSEGFSDAEKLLTECRKLGLEGIVSKKKDAPYRSGRCDWLKIKCAQWKEENKDRGELFGQGR
jgi:bifunctional non-homologous end joining protein LigD